MSTDRGGAGRTSAAAGAPPSPGARAGGLTAHVVVRWEGFALDVDLAVAPGEVVGLLGPNGAGKSTLLRALAGLVALDEGRTRLDDRVLDDPAAGVRVAPEDRHVGVVFQDLRLFPTLSAVENVAFGLRARGVGRGAARAEAERWLERVGLGGQRDARPGQLSGGQAQRVALARALAPGPGLLVLDEPLSALDATTRSAVRRDLRTHLDAFAGPVLVVTHDPVDVLTLADRLVVLEGGRVLQDGPPAEVAARPRSPWVADLLGVTLLPGTVGPDGDVDLDDGGIPLVTRSTAAPDRGEQVYVAIRPRTVAVHRERPAGSPRNVWEAVVTGVEADADRVRVRTDGPPAVVAEITPAALAEMGLVAGDTVWLAVKASEVDVYHR